MQYIGIDMSKDTFHAALDEKSIREFSNTRTGMATFMLWLKEHACAQITTSIGVEATGVYHL